MVSSTAVLPWSAPLHRSLDYLFVAYAFMFSISIFQVVQDNRTAKLKEEIFASFLSHCRWPIWFTFISYWFTFIFDCQLSRKILKGTLSVAPQIEGSKHWMVYPPINGSILPLKSSRDFTQDELPDPCLEVILEPGMVWYDMVRYGMLWFGMV